MTVIKKYDGIAWQEVVVGESGQWNTAQTIRAETASTVLTSADAGRVIAMNSSSATAITVNGSTSFSPGQRVDFLRQGTGDVIIGSSGVTINATPGSKLRARYSGASLLCIRPNVYVLTGDLDELTFTPLQLSPALWLDASDTSTITASSGSVSQWNDKSASGLNFAQATGVSQPTTGTVTLNNRNVLSFDSNDFLRVGATSLGRNVAVITGYFVFRYATNPTTERVVFRVSAATEATRFNIDAGTTSQKMRAGGRRLDANSFAGVTSTSTVATSWTYYTSIMNYGAAGLRTFLNGADDGFSTSFQTAGTSSDTDSFRTTIGAANADAAAVTLLGEIAEVLLFHSAHDTTTRQLVESYLTAKWGL